MLAPDNVNIPDPSLVKVPAPEAIAELTVVLPVPPIVSPIEPLLIPPLNVSVVLLVSLLILTGLVDKVIAPA